MSKLFQILAAAFAILGAATGATRAEPTWSLVTSQTIDTRGDVAGIALATAPRGTAIRLAAREGSVTMRAVVVTLGSGKVHLEERSIVLKKGERTRPILLGAIEEPIRSVEIVLAPGGEGKVTLEVWALRSTQQAPAAAAGTPVGDPGNADPGKTSSIDDDARRAAEQVARRQTLDAATQRAAEARRRAEEAIRRADDLSARARELHKYKAPKEVIGNAPASQQPAGTSTRGTTGPGQSNAEAQSAEAAARRAADLEVADAAARRAAEEAARLHKSAEIAMREASDLQAEARRAAEDGERKSVATRDDARRMAKEEADRRAADNAAKKQAEAELAHRAEEARRRTEAASQAKSEQAKPPAKANKVGSRSDKREDTPDSKIFIPPVLPGGGIVISGQVKKQSGGHVSGIPVDRTAATPKIAVSETRGSPPDAVARVGYSYALETLDACVAEKSCTPVPVFFGTDRNETTAQGRTSFGTERAGRVQLGRVFVTVPSRNRVAGELNVPGWTDWVRGTPEGGDPKRHFTIPRSGVTLFDSEAELIAAVKEHVASGIGTHKDHAFVYVHGYRTPWEFAAMRTAQIAYDLSPDDAPFGTPFLYSWPSQGATADYITDLDHSRIAIPHLTGFLRMVAERTGASHIHVIAHSMGNFPVIHALAKLAEEMPAKSFSEVVLAAPDVEKKEFEDVASGLVKIAKGVTLYASSSDIALLVSRLLRRDKPRAGDAKEPPGPALVAGIDTVDISRLSTGFMSYLSWNHDKYADSPVLLNDISTLFRTGDRRAPPNERNIRFRLQQAPAIQARFWRYED